MKRMAEVTAWFEERSDEERWLWFWMKVVEM